MPDLPTPARTILKDIFGYDSFRSGQEEIVQTLLNGVGILAVMPTGSGKSLCFQVPALVRGGLTLVVSPLVALMEDQVAALKFAGVAAETINSSRSYDQNATIWRRVAAGEVRLLYIAPERLMTERMLGALSRLPLSMIAIDEAHCISRWGPSFRPEYEQLARLGSLFPGVPIAALTATADEATRNDIRDKLFNGEGKLFISGFDRPNINLAVAMRRDWKKQLLNFIRPRERECGIVYCLSRKKTDETAAFLKDNGYPAIAYHAGMEKEHRANNQDQFMTVPGTIIVATIAFGMGIDKSDVRYVFHTNLPGSVEAYYQEIGRAGRDGSPADTMMLYGLDDIRMRRMFIEEENGDDDHKRREHKRLDALIAYCEAPECRRQALLSYFGESKEPCDNCDICLNPPEMDEGTEIAQSVLRAVSETGERFGAVHLVDVLCGGNTERIRKFGHDQIFSYGTGKDIRKEEWRSIIRQMTSSGYLELDIQGYGGLSITEKGQSLARGDDQFRYRKDTIVKAETTKSARVRPQMQELSEADMDLFNALKAQRLMLAKERKVPAYAIFPDRTLADMAQKKPRSETDFADVHGVGKSKLEKFSACFLAVIAAYGGETEVL